MRAEINKDGTLAIIADTVVEAWALNGIALFQDDDVGKRLIVDCSVLNVCEADIGDLT